MNSLRDLVELYFKERSIVNHHISSFDDFLSTLDNPNSRMQKIVDNLRVSAEDLDRGFIRLDPDKTDGRIVEITASGKLSCGGKVKGIARRWNSDRSSLPSSRTTGSDRKAIHRRIPRLPAGPFKSLPAGPFKRLPAGPFKRLPAGPAGPGAGPRS